MGGSIARSLPKMRIPGTRKSLAQVADELKFSEVSPEIDFRVLNGPRYNRAFSVDFSEARGVNVVLQQIHESGPYGATLRDVLLFVHDVILYTDNQKLSKLKVNIFALGTVIKKGTSKFVPVVSIDHGRCQSIKLYFVGEEVNSKRAVTMFRYNLDRTAA